MTNAQNTAALALFAMAPAATLTRGQSPISLAQVEAARLDNGWSIGNLCRVSSVDRRHYLRVREGSRPLTPATLARLTAGLRILAADISANEPPPPRILAAGAEYRVIADGMRRRREELDLTCEEVDYLAGFTGGHTSKLENWRTSNGRGFGEISARLWCEVLGVQLAVIEGVVPVATMRMANPIGSVELGRRFDANQRRLEAMRRTKDAKRAGRIGG